MGWRERRTWQAGEVAPSCAYVNALEAVAEAARRTADMLEGEKPGVLNDALAVLERTPTHLVKPAGSPNE